MVELTIAKIYDSRVQIWLQSAGFWGLVGGSVVGYYVNGAVVYTDSRSFRAC